MPSDIAGLIGAVNREVIERNHEGRLARVVVASRRYDTTRVDLWDALTNPARIPRWFLPISGDLRLGGRYQLQGNAGGSITECDPPHRLKLTWEYGGDVSWVEVGLTDDPTSGTRLRLEHMAFVAQDRWDEFGPGAVGVGWDTGLFGLGKHLTTEGSMTPEEGLAWLGSAEGKAFVRLSSDDWCRASIAGGTDQAAARAAAGRTTAAYTGEAPPSA